MAVVPEVVHKKTHYRISLDIETTGLSCYKDDVIQVAVAIRRDGRTLTFKSYVSTSLPISDKIFEITHISKAMLVGAPSFETVLRLLQTFISETCEDEDVQRVLVAYNGMSFDIPMLVRIMQRTWTREQTSDWWRLLRISYLFDPLLYLRTTCANDTRWTRRINGNACLKLGEVHMSMYQQKIDGAHDALNDCLAVLRIMEDAIFSGFEHETTTHTPNERHTRNLCRFIDHLFVDTSKKRKAKTYGQCIVTMVQKQRQKLGVS